jgi:hypothetical protein
MAAGEQHLQSFSQLLGNFEGLLKELKLSVTVLNLFFFLRIVSSQPFLCFFKCKLSNFYDFAELCY